VTSARGGFERVSRYLEKRKEKNDESTKNGELDNEIAVLTMENSDFAQPVVDVVPHR
jgi:hypothetical protein